MDINLDISFIKFIKMVPDAIVPSRKFLGDAGLDVYSLETVYIGAGKQEVIRTGITLAYAPPNSVIQVWPKSGLDAKFALHTGAGIIDANYRGEILIVLKNMSDFSICIEKGDPVAQLVVVKCVMPAIELVETSNETERGSSGGVASVVNNKGEL